MKRIVCIGDLCADLIIPYGAVKKSISDIKNGDIKSQSVELRSGGTIGNASIVLGRLGAKPVFITDLCGDSLGLFLKAEMEKNGVDMSFSPLGGYGAMVCIAVLDEDGERTMFSWVPPGSRYPTFSKESFSERLYSMDSILFTGGMTLNNDVPSMEAVYSFIRDMKERTDSKFIFDLNTRIESYGLDADRRHYYDLYIGLADVILGSGIEEFGPICGKKELGACAEELSRDKKLVIARDGAGPVIWAEDGCIRGEVQVEPVEVMNTVGAGDSFDAAFIYGYSRGFSIKRCIELGNMTAASVISHREQLVVPRPEELL